MDMYKPFSEKVRELLSSMFSSRGIVTHSIISREKGPEELREKITREGKASDAVVNGITDLAGVRIITCFSTDLDKIVQLIFERNPCAG